MQKDNGKTRRTRKVLQSKGYYIALALCLAAVGVSGYVFARSVIHNRSVTRTEAQAQTTISVPVVPDQIPQTTDQATGTPSGAVSETEEGQEEQNTAGSPTMATAELETEPAVAAVSLLEGVEATLELPEAQTQPAQAEEICWPVSGLVTEEYSMTALVYNQTMGDWRVHEGIDIQAGEGTPVLCACAGTVAAVYQDDLKGCTVVVEHPDGYRTLYANLAESVMVGAGEQVASGTQLGYVGTSALGESAEPPHLHLEVYHNEALIDPVDFLP